MSESHKQTSHGNIEKLASELRRINTEIGNVLERLPLSNHQQVARLATLAEKQKRLIRTPSGTAPERVRVFLDNAKHSARYLQMRYADAMKNGRLRKPR